MISLAVAFAFLAERGVDVNEFCQGMDIVKGCFEQLIELREICGLLWFEYPLEIGTMASRLCIGPA